MTAPLVRRPLVRRAPLFGRRQGGQAIVEFIIAAMFFLVPLYLIIIALGKFADVQAGASQSARYAAWERTVWLDDANWRARMASGNQKSTAELRSEIARRVVGQNTLNIKATDKSRNNLGNGQLAMWTDGEGRALLERYADLTLSENGQALTATQCPTCVVPLALNIAGLATLGIDVPQNNMVVANAGIQVAANSAALQRLFPAYPGFNGLQLTDKVALLPNEWMANGRDGVTTVVKDAVPTATPLVKTAMTAAVAPMLPFAWEVIPLKIGDIRPDEVPADRLQ